MAKDDNIGGRLVEGTIWYVSARWIIKFIGIASSAILIRLLTPEDFGIIAKAFFILWLFEDFITLNFSHGLVRLKDPDKEDYDTAFTLNVITGLALFLLINISAYGIYYFFDQSDIAMIVHIFSLRPVFMALESPRIIDLQKRLKLSKRLYISCDTSDAFCHIFSVSMLLLQRLLWSDCDTYFWCTLLMYLKLLLYALCAKIDDQKAPCIDGFFTTYDACQCLYKYIIQH